MAVLFARADSVYKTMPGCDVWDIERDARLWPGGAPVVAHPPCRLWGKLRQFAKAENSAAERQLAIDAVHHLRRWGGVLEHPAESSLWAHVGLPLPSGAPDQFGGWTLGIEQHWWGHRARKRTWLYVVGCQRQQLPFFQPALDLTMHVVSGSHTIRKGHPKYRPNLTKPEREHTPPLLAAWLVEVARRCRV